MNFGDLDALRLAFAPLAPWWMLGLASGLGLLIVAFGFFRRARGTWLRLAALIALFLALANPSVVHEQRQAQRDVALIVKDVSQSQSIGGRRAAADRDVSYLQQELKQFPDLDTRVVEGGSSNTSGLEDRGTRLFETVSHALADVSPQRVAGVVLVTDGQVHDVPPAAHPGLGAPVHALLTGEPNEGDRRLFVKQAPSFGIVGKPISFTIRVEDLGGTAAERASYPTSTHVIIRRDGGPPQEIAAPVGKDIEIPQLLDHGGPTIFEIETKPGPKELTLDNDRAAIVVNGVRDRLHVLLVSGEPHAGERTWRNLLKADPLVDLVHFTILRPPEKQDGTPINELSLIAFPIRELFDVKLNEFDLVIFDRYNRRGVLPQTYFDNIAHYVENGGALLEAAGPSDSPALTLYRTPLGEVLPAEPSGEDAESGFKPRLTADGYRHPVTADLPGGSPDPKADPHWGRWFRQIGAVTHRGTTVMSGLNGAPLLILDHVGQGRVAQLLSDDIWLWTRGFEGGGPQAELLRRLAYWLMKEPDLEENDLRGTVSGNRLTVQRRSLHPDPHPVSVTFPDGKHQDVSLTPESGGRDVGVIPITESGLYRIIDGTHTALAAAGALNPLELGDVRTTADKLKPVTDATGGGIVWAGPKADLPSIRRVRAGRDAAGPGWIGFREGGDYIVTGATEIPLLPAWLGLTLALGLLILAWRREGR